MTSQPNAPILITKRRYSIDPVADECAIASFPGECEECEHPIWIGPRAASMLASSAQMALILCAECAKEYAARGDLGPVAVQL